MWTLCSCCSRLYWHFFFFFWTRLLTILNVLTLTRFFDTSWTNTVTTVTGVPVSVKSLDRVFRGGARTWKRHLAGTHAFIVRLFMSWKHGNRRETAKKKNGINFIRENPVSVIYFSFDRLSRAGRVRVYDERSLNSKHIGAIIPFKRTRQLGVQASNN